MRKYYFIISSVLFLILGISCTKEENKSEKQMASRPAAPIQNGEVRIGTQVWMTKNLNVSRYRNGDPIPQVQANSEWGVLTTGAWCYYQNNTANGPVYGKLYNWYAVNDPRGLAPVGYHVPTDAEWSTLINFLDPTANGGANWPNLAGGKMKQTGTGLWFSPNAAATNSCRFTGLPGGYREDYGNGGAFYDVGSDAYFWSSTETFPSSGQAWNRHLGFDNGDAFRGSDFKGHGFSVRCLRD